MRVNVDSEALTDPRIVKRLPRYSGLAFHDALGRLICVWHRAYVARSAELSVVDVDDVADRDGFAAAMVKAELADQAAADRVRVRGVESRIGYLHQRAEAAKKGGKARAQKAVRADGKFQPNAGRDQANAGERQPNAGDAPGNHQRPPADLSPDPDPSPDRDPVLDPSLSPDPGADGERETMARPSGRDGEIGAVLDAWGYTDDFSRKTIADQLDRGRRAEDLALIGRAAIAEALPFRNTGMGFLLQEKFIGDALAAAKKWKATGRRSTDRPSAAEMALDLVREAEAEERERFAAGTDAQEITF